MPSGLRPSCVEYVFTNASMRAMAPSGTSTRGPPRKPSLLSSPSSRFCEYSEFPPLNDSRGASPKKPVACVMPGMLYSSAIGSRASVGNDVSSRASMDPPVTASRVLSNGRSCGATTDTASSVASEVSTTDTDRMLPGWSAPMGMVVRT